MNKEEIFKLYMNEVVGKKEINIEDFVYNIALNYEITDPGYENNSCVVEESLPIIHINNAKLFKDKLYEYVQTVANKESVMNNIPFDSNEDKIKYITSMLFVNATAEDFGNPYPYMDKYTDAAKDDTFEDLKDVKSLGKLNSFKEAELKVKSKQQSMFLETPQRLEFTLSKIMQDGNEYTVSLPSVSCFCYNKGRDKILNIAAIQNKKKEDSERNIFEKQVNRQKFKLNSGIEKEEQDVEPLAILSLVSAICLAKEKGATKVEMPDFMPLRWYAKELANVKRSKMKGLDLEELRDEQIRIQTNVTDKFLRTLVRMSDQLGMVDITNIPGISGDYLEAVITDKIVREPNNILNEIKGKIIKDKEKFER